MAYETTSGEAVATVHDGIDAFSRALPMQLAPTLLGAVRTSARVFALMLESKRDFERAVGLEMLPLMTVALYLPDEEPS